MLRQPMAADGGPPKTAFACWPGLARVAVFACLHATPPSLGYWSSWKSAAGECLPSPSLPVFTTGRTCPSKLYKYKSKQSLKRSVFLLAHSRRTSAKLLDRRATALCLSATICLVFITIAILCLCSLNLTASASSRLCLPSRFDCD